MEKTLKILLVPDPTSPNGEDAFCREIVKRAAARGHSCVMRAAADGPDHADAVVVNSLQTRALLAAREAGKPAVLRLIDSYCGAPADDLAEVKSFANAAERVLVPSAYMKDIVVSWGLSEERVSVAPYAYDQIFAQQIALVTMRAARPSGFGLVTSGPLDQANLPALETVLYAVSRLRLDCHLAVLGDGPALDALKARAASLMMNGRVTFLGDLPHPKKMEYLRAAKAFIEPSGLQGFPSLALHAMSEGCPVVGAAAGSVPELVQAGRNGLLFRPGDAHDLAEQSPDLGLHAGAVAEADRRRRAHRRGPPLGRDRRRRARRRRKPGGPRVICALLIDPDDSPDFPGNSAEVMSRPLAAYPLMAAKGSQYVRRLYAQTSSPVVARAAAQYAAINLLPPPPNGDARLSDEALIAAGWRQISEDLKAEKIVPEMLVVLFANTGTVSSALINGGVQALLDDPKLDSAATVSCYERWTPRRALRETPDGRLVPYADCVPEAGLPWFPDWGAAIVRPRVLDALKSSSPPLAYLGKNILPLKQFGGGPVDRQWQVPKMEYWLKKQGVRDSPRPEPKLKPAPAPKPDRRR